MKVAVVYFETNNSNKLRDVSRGIAEGIESTNHTVDLVDGMKDINTKLTVYEYIAVGAQAESFWGGRINTQVKHFLSNAGMISGKRCFAYTIPKGIRQIKTLKTIMDVMEHEGMFLKNSQIVASYEEGKQIGAALL